MTMLLKITSSKQLRELALLIREEGKSIVEKLADVTIELDLFEYLDTDLRLKQVAFEDQTMIDFVKPSDIHNEVVTYFLDDKTLVEYKKDHDKIYSLSDDADLHVFTEDEFEVISRTFLTVCDYDLAHGYTDEDILGAGRKHEQIFKAFFGGSTIGKMI